MTGHQPVDAALRNLGVPEHRVSEVSDRVSESEVKEERIRDRIEQYHARRELYTCSECGTVADLRVEIKGEVRQIINVQKVWVTLHHDPDNDHDILYFHFDEDEVDRGREGQQLADALEELVDLSPKSDPEDTTRDYPQQPGPEPRTDGGDPYPEGSTSLTGGRFHD